jgi:hypothetical protein
VDCGEIKAFVEKFNISLDDAKRLIEYVAPSWLSSTAKNNTPNQVGQAGFSARRTATPAHSRVQIA